MIVSKVLFPRSTLRRRAPSSPRNISSRRELLALWRFFRLALAPFPSPSVRGKNQDIPPTTQRSRQREFFREGTLRNPPRLRLVLPLDLGRFRRANPPRRMGRKQTKALPRSQASRRSSTNQRAPRVLSVIGRSLYSSRSSIRDLVHL